MKEIKFRAWDKINNRLSYEICEIDFNNRTVSYRHSIRPDGCGVISNREMKNIILEQYTGLKDKNGKEIYEGDICRWVSTEGTPHTWPIVWDNEMLCFCHHNMPFFTLLDSGYYQPPREWPSGLEIIGNIHENPELLNEK